MQVKSASASRHRRQLSLTAIFYLDPGLPPLACLDSADRPRLPRAHCTALAGWLPCARGAPARSVSARVFGRRDHASCRSRARVTPISQPPRARSDQAPMHPCPRPTAPGATGRLRPARDRPRHRCHAPWAPQLAPVSADLLAACPSSRSRSSARHGHVASGPTRLGCARGISAHPDELTSSPPSNASVSAAQI